MNTPPTNMQHMNMPPASTLHIANARLLDPATDLDEPGDLYIAGGRIVGVGTAPEGFQADETVDAQGHLLMPGLVDLAVRLGEPGGEHKHLLQSELAAAVAGGVTTLCCMPDTDPPLDEPGLVQMLRHRAEAMGAARVLPLGALTRRLEGRELTEMAELRDAGCIAFSQAEAPLRDTRVLQRAMLYAATFKLPLRLRPQDAWLAGSGVAHEGEVSTRLGLPGIPVTAETVALTTLVILMRNTGARVHVERVSSLEGVEIIRAAKDCGLPISCDVSIQHVHLSDMDIGYFDSRARLSPPLRSVRDRDAIVRGLLDGTIDAICSDHSPIDNDDKLLPFGEAKPGATALELLLPMTLALAAQKGISLNRALAWVSSAPAKLLGLSAGRLQVGCPADLARVDLAQSWRPAADALLSHGKHTPFAEFEMRARVVQTWVNGKRVYGAESLS